MDVDQWKSVNILYIIYHLTRLISLSLNTCYAIDSYLFCFFVLVNIRYDVSKFHAVHPGGSQILLAATGRDATEEFFSLHRQEVLVKYEKKLLVGTMEGFDEDDTVVGIGEISEVPYSEHPAWLNFESPYFTDEHLQMRQEVRAWLQREFKDSGIADRYEDNGKKVPDSIYAKMGDVGLLAGRLGPGEHLQIWAREVKKDPQATIFGIPVDTFDYFHEQILHEEIGRIGSGGFVAGCGDGMVIGLPPVKQFGPKWMKNKVLPEVLSGKKRICLAISEPQAGSDVANLVTTGTKSEDGKYYIVTGTKKWITGGHHADYFVMAVRTSKKGMAGLSVLLLERGMPGLSTRSIKTSYSATAG